MQGFTQVTPDIPCVDRWALAGYRSTAMMAYLLLEKNHTLRLVYPVRCHVAQEYLEIRYSSAVPQEWTLDALAEMEQKIVERLRQEQDELRDRMENMLGERDTGVLPAMAQMISRYNELYEILREYEAKQAA